MGRRKLSTEERHKKQKDKLDSKAITSEVIKYVPQKNFKLDVVEKSLRAGFNCAINNDSVILFSNSEDEKKVTEWLLKNFGKEEDNMKTGKKELRIPFTYGFSKIDRQTQFVSATESVEEEDNG